MKKTIADLQAEIDRISEDHRFANKRLKQVALDAVGWPYKRDEIGSWQALSILVNALRAERAYNTMLQDKIEALEAIAPWPNEENER